MQPISVCLATINPLRWPCLVPRPRLWEGLRSQPARGPLFIQGQAAQGKTSLVADFLKSQNANIVWIAIEESSNAAEAFATQFLDALAHASPAALSLRSLDHASPPQQALERIYDELPEGLEIVIDGLDRLAAGSPAYDQIGELCRRSTGRWRLWLLSRRAETFSALGEWIVAGRWVLNNEDLAFTPAETDQYFRHLHGLEPDPDWIDRLHRLTDGWAGGLALITRALAQRPQMSGDGSLESLLETLSVDAAPFFDAEVFGRISDHQRHLLLQLSLPDLIDPELLRKIPDMAAGPTLIRHFSENSGFLHIVGHGQEAPLRYRFTPLFREYLHTRMAMDLAPEERQRYCHDLGLAYDTQGELKAAIPWYLKSGNPLSAAEAIKGAGIDMIIEGRLARLEFWLTQLPSQQIQSDPWLFLLLTLARRLKGQARSVADYRAVWEAFQTQKDMRGCMLTAAFSIEALVFQGRTPDDILTWIRRGEALLSVQGEVPYHAWAKLLLWLQIAFGYIAGGLDLARGMSAARNASLLAGKMGNAGLIAQASIIFSLGLIDEGRFDQARARLAKAVPESESLSESPPALTWDILKRLATVDMDRRHGDLNGAEMILPSVRTDIETHGLVFLYPRYVEATGMIQIARKAWIPARLTARHFLDVALLSGSMHFKALAHRLNALVEYHCGNHSQSAAAADRALKMMEDTGVDILPAMQARQLRAMAALHLDDHSQALMLLNRARGYFEATANAPALAETHLMLALAHDRANNLKAVQLHLDQGFNMAAGEKILPFVVLSPGDREAVCAMADRNNESLGRPASSSPPSQERVEVHPVGLHTTLAALFDADDRPQAPPGWLDIRTFGGFAVLRDGRQPITERQWGGNRPKLLFKALLVHGLREIPRDIIMDNLWPESLPSSARQNFKVTLHRLRKSLEPDLNSHQSSAFVHLKDNLISLDKSRCRVDLEEFLVCCKEIKRHLADGTVEQIPPLGHHLVALYQGDFMPEEPYAPWMEMKRWALRDTYFETVLAVSSVYRDGGQLEAAADCCRTAIQIDPFQERVIRELIMLYTRLGRHKDARDVFEQFRSALKMELGMEPDGEMLALIKNGPVNA
ncbi:BTAD domain-containing putative transcriptional regulator [Desulfatitalea tepidiphila]|uniref:BTAD domain-containing putative transcriptional regulator n=1 Tax=Desulfatitalea tepidiphila TaxID=1185843 RepID=UPI0006B5CBCC|nr:BTAD domain-containing putative transcriptional regulator [Desulfatitalea tepidiphila]